MVKEKIKEFYKEYKLYIGLAILLTIFFIGLAILLFDNNGLRRSEKEYKADVKALNDSIKTLNEKYKSNTDTIYIAEKEANKQREIGDNINRQTNDVRNQIPKEINRIDNLTDDSSIFFFTNFTNSYRFSPNTD